MIKKTAIIIFILSILSVISYGQDVSLECDEVQHLSQFNHNLVQISVLIDKINTDGLSENNSKILNDFIHLATGLIEDGYVFDKESVENHLYLFVQQFKRIGKAHEFSREDIIEFFKQSQLSKSLAKSIVSNEVSKIIGASFYQGNRYLANVEGVRSIEEMFNDPTYVDIFLNSKEGEHLSNQIIDGVLVPSIVGGEKNKYIANSIAVTVFTDKKDYGVMERFTHLYYESELKKSADRSSFRTVYLGGGSTTKIKVPIANKYDWDKLRATESGRKAILLYSQKVIAPVIAGQGDEIYDVKLKSIFDEMAELLEQAQDEVDDD